MERFEFQHEHKRLADVLSEIKSQLDLNLEVLEKDKDDIISVQKLVKDYVDITPRNLDDVANIWQYQTLIDGEVRDYKVSEEKVKKLKKLYISPYFGRIDFREEGSEDIEQIYIGLFNFTDRQDNILIYDWRAPVSSMFYDYEIGKAQYKCPVGYINGDILLKRQYKILNQKILYMFDSSIKIDDEILQEILSKNADEKMKTIVTSIQKEQNSVIRNESNKILIVHGAAGSGKTSIALHRAAYLMYKFRDYMKAENIMILSPNNIFSDYISNVLPELGEDNVKEETFLGYFSQNDDVKNIESPYDQMEYLLNEKNNFNYKNKVLNIKYKNSEDFINVLDNYVAYINSADYRKFEDVYAGDRMIISEKELDEMFEQDRKLPFKNRLEVLRQRVYHFLKQYENDRKEAIRNELKESDEYMEEDELNLQTRIALHKELQPVRDFIDNMFNKDCRELYVKLFEDKLILRFFPDSEGNNLYDINSVCQYSSYAFSKGIFPYEDWIAYIYMQCQLGYLPRNSVIKHLIIDEAQDYTSLQYRIIRRIFADSKITILGDMKQSINYYMNIGTYERISEAFKGLNTIAVNLKKSYRSTKQITDFCKKIIPDSDNIEYLNRQGDEPRIFRGTEKNDVFIKMRDSLKNLADKGYESVAVICRTADKSLKCYNVLKNFCSIHLVSKRDSRYIKGVQVIPSYLAKGLEFDAVLVYMEEGEYFSQEERNLLYTVCSRAMHALEVFIVGSEKIPFGSDFNQYEMNH